MISACGVAALLPEWRMFEHTILPGGTAGFLLADTLKHSLNLAGTAVVLCTTVIVSLYLVSTFTLATVERWLSPLIAFFNRIQDRWLRFLEHRRENKLARLERKREAAELRAAERDAQYAARAAARVEVPEGLDFIPKPEPAADLPVPIVQTVDPALSSRSRKRAPRSGFGNAALGRSHGDCACTWPTKRFRPQSTRFPSAC